MNVYLPLSKDVKTGKGFFLQRLSDEFRKQGIIIANASDHCDIALHLSKIKEQIKAKKHIIRYDGVYHNIDQDYISMNQAMAKHMRYADGVIYQSEFSKAMCDCYLGKFNGKSKIIFNGADIDHYKKVKPIASDKDIFLAVSRWRPHKRLKDIIECFLMADIKDSILYVAGPLEKSGLVPNDIRRYRSSNIKFMGSIDQNILDRYYVSCRASLHLCWFDSCPNSVVEAIAAGHIVISNNVGGTPELVSRSNGFVCQIDPSYDYKPVRLYKPPRFNRDIVANAVRNSINSITISNDFINIKIIANQYLKFFKEILG